MAGWHTTVAHRAGGPLAAELDAAADRSLTPPANRLRQVLRRSRWTQRAAPMVERWGIRRVLRRTRPQLVWCNTVVTATWAREAAAAGIPTVLYSHEPARWVEATLGRGGGDLPDAVVLAACSTEAAEVLATHLEVPLATVHVVPSPVDVAAVRAAALASPPASPSDPAPIIVGCGTADHRKGFDVFVAAARTPRAEELGLRFRWVGAADDEARAAAGDHVELVGEVADATPHLATATAFALTSRAESFPLVVLEAMALGVPVVSSDLPGPREQLGDTGTFVPADDPEALVDAIAELVADPTQAGERGEAGRVRCVDRWDRPHFDRRVADLAALVAPNRPLRVVHLLWRLSLGGGIQHVVRRVALATDPAEVELHIVTARPHLPEDRTDELPLTLHGLGHTGTGTTIADKARLSLGAARAVRSIDADVIQLHSGVAWLGAVSRLRRTAPVVLEVHDAPGSGRHGRATDVIEGWWPRWLGATAVCHSTSVATEVRNRWRTDRVVTFPLAVDTQLFSPTGPAERARWRSDHGIPADLPLCVAVGRFVPSKAFDDLLRAVRLLADRPGGVGLLLIGVGPMEDELRSLVDELDLQDRVWLPGLVNDAALALAIGSADLLCSSSTYEGFGLTLVEAMACGIPTVARPVGGVTDIVRPGETGLLTPDLEVASLARAIDEVLSSPDRAAMGVRSRQVAAEEYSAAALARRFVDLYRAVADDATVR